jgi:DNA-binding transcriptional LysR family regulator
VRIGSLSTGIAAVVAPALAQLRSIAPGLRIQVTEYEPTTAFDRLDTGEFDVVVSVVHGATPTSADARYFRVDLLTDVMDAVLPEGHPLASADGVRLTELAAEPWVSPAPDDPCAATTLVACAAAGFRPEIEHFCLEWDAVTALVAAGAGVALVPRTAQPLRQAGLVVCPLLGPQAARLMFAATRAGAESHPAVATVLDAMTSVATRRPDAAIGEQAR